MTLTEKYIEDGIDKGVLFGEIRLCQELLCKDQPSNDELRLKSESELQVLHDQLKVEVRQKLLN